MGPWMLVRYAFFDGCIGVLAGTHHQIVCWTLHFGIHPVATTVDSLLLLCWQDWSFFKEKGKMDFSCCTMYY